MRLPRKAAATGLCISVILCISCVEAATPPPANANQKQQARHGQLDEKELSKQTVTQSDKPASVKSHDATKQREPPPDSLPSGDSAKQENIAPLQQPKPARSSNANERPEEQTQEDFDDDVRTPRRADPDAHVSSGSGKVSSDNRDIPQQETPTPKSIKQDAVKTDRAELETPTHVDAPASSNPIESEHLKGDEGIQEGTGIEPHGEQSDDDVADDLSDLSSDSGDAKDTVAGGNAPDQEPATIENDHLYISKLHEHLFDEPDIDAGNPDLLDNRRMQHRTAIYKSMGLTDPVNYDKFNMDDVAEIFTKKSRDGTLRTIVLMHPEPSGRRTMYIYRQRMLDSGDVYQESEEYSDVVPQFVPTEKEAEGRTCYVHLWHFSNWFSEGSSYPKTKSLQ